MAMPLTLRRFTVGDLERMVRAGILRDDDRVELLDGQIVAMSPIEPPHASCVKRLIRLFSPLAASGRVSLGIQDPIVLSEHQAPQPDVALLEYRADGYRARDPGPTDTVLLIEVADTDVRTARRGEALASLAFPDVALPVDDILG